jgi:S-adenosylmethionine:tRNA ribosyltransferase-isomerase
MLDSGVMRADELDYHLPPSQIAQRPLTRREDSKLLHLHRESGAFADRLFVDFPALLEGNELLVVNNARVIPARLFGQRAGIRADGALDAVHNDASKGRVEVFLLRRASHDIWQALVRPGRKMPIGARVLFGQGELEGEVIARGELGERTMRFCSHDTVGVAEHLEKLGHVPLPPYIDRAEEPSDRERYQTVFATQPGAVAAPTAGLHFTPEILQAIRNRGVEICELTLDVGLGTFQPVHTETLEAHPIHSESYEIPCETAERVAGANAAGRRVVAIGTTAVRALEDSALRAAETGSRDLILPGQADARLFITPGFQFRVVDALLTNFHLPRSTLLGLVCAFAGRDYVLAAYRHAVAAGYRFYSYGDCMWIR